MNNQEIKHNIEQNLIAFHLTWKDYPSISFFENTTFYTIKNTQHTWPNYLLNKNIDNITFNTLLQEVKDKKNKNSADFWLLNSELAFANQSNLRQADFFPVKSWKGMQVNKKELYKIDSIKDFEIELVSVDNLNHWITIINKEIYQKNILTDKLFTAKLSDPDFQLYIGIYKSEIVATSLSYFDGVSVGLYYAATKSTHRKKGFGTAAVKRTFNDAIAKGNTNLILHATKMAVPLYEKLEFTSYNQLIVFAHQ